MAKLVDVGLIASYFETLPDPRHTRNCKHLLVDVVAISVAAILCNCDGPTAIHRWATLQQGWLAQRLKLPNGIPARDCIRRLLIAHQPDAFQLCFRDWIAAARPVQPTANGRLVAIDGKTCRGSHDKAHTLGPLALVKFAEGGTSLAKDWDPDVKDRLYPAFLDFTRASVKRLTDDGHTYIELGRRFAVGMATTIGPK